MSPCSLVHSASCQSVRTNERRTSHLPSVLSRCCSVVLDGRERSTTATGPFFSFLICVVRTPSVRSPSLIFVS